MTSSLCCCCCCCRYGAALFIKPAVVEENAKLWAKFDQSLQEEMEQRAMQGSR
jgi:hypothetical protein